MATTARIQYSEPQPFKRKLLATPRYTPPAHSESAPSRVQDDRLLRGQGNFVHSMVLPEMLHAAFLRSPHARARIVRLELHNARVSRDVVAVFSGSDVAHLPMPSVNRLVKDLRLPRRALMADRDIHFVGEPLAIVVARSRAAAEAAAEQIEIDVEELPVCCDLQRQPAVYEELPGNESYELRYGRDDEIESEVAPMVLVTVATRQPRVVAMAMEPRAALADWRQPEAELHVWLPTQTPFRARDDLSAILGLPRERVVVIAPDVGGAFGSKASVGLEDIVVAWAAVRLGRPVKWCASRSDEFVAGMHGRGARLAGELGVCRDGRLASMKARVSFPLGAWMPYSAAVPARNAARILPGPYRVPAVDIIASALVSNAAPVNIYRGAGRPEAALLMEQLMDSAARALHLDPVALRQLNLLDAASLPRQTPTGETLDSGDYPGLLARACERFDYATARSEQALRRAAGEWVGIGVAMYVEPCGQGFESATVKLSADGSVEVASGTTSQGQGHETAFALIAAAALSVPEHRVRVVHGNTATCPEGIGALASRSMAIGGSAVARAAQQARTRRDAGEALPLQATVRFEARGEAWSSGCVMARLRVDRDTGEPSVEQIAWVDDAGVAIDPAGIKSQLMGGLAQGLGQALMERIVYDSQGQLLTGSLMDYAIPRADQMPPVVLDSLCTPSPFNLLGAKGVGEAGCIGVPAALLNAAVDALSTVGVTHLDLPLTSQSLWRAAREAEAMQQGKS